MKQKLIIGLVGLVTCFSTGYTIAATPPEMMTYLLPKNQVKVHVLIEKRSYKPSELAQYAEKYMQLRDVATHAKDEYRVVGVNFEPVAVPDSSKLFRLTWDSKRTIFDVKCNENGVLTAINATAPTTERFEPFVPQPAKAQPHAKDYMDADMLAAATPAKQAELVAQAIYDIRESRNLLARGQADFMPKDGEQLRLMLDQLQKQETALLSMFQGSVVVDTTVIVRQIEPQHDEQEAILFRLSKYLGVLDENDLGGTPYYYKVEDIQQMPATGQNDPIKDRDDIGLRVNLPNKIRIDITKDKQVVGSFEMYCSQMGRTEKISGQLFNKKQTTHIVLDPLYGSIRSIEMENLKD